MLNTCKFVININKYTYNKEQNKRKTLLNSKETINVQKLLAHSSHEFVYIFS